MREEAKEPRRQGHRRRRRRGVYRCRSIRIDLTEEEYAAVREAAAREQFAVSAYAGQVLVAVAQGSHSPEFAPLRELMRHLLQASGQVRRIGSNLNQAVATLHSLGEPTGALCEYARNAAKAVENLDEVTEEIRRRLP